MNLITFLREEENTRKVFGKKELEIIGKQLTGYDLTQSEMNRLSRDIRKKFEFIKKTSKYCEEFKLEKNQDNKKIIRKSLRVILNDRLKDNIKAVLLFGSFTDKTFTKKSDIDVCVVFDKDLSLKEATLFRIRTSGELPEKVDVQVFNALPQKIKRDIARNHKVLYKTAGYDNISFSISYLKDPGYFLRMKNIFGAS